MKGSLTSLVLAGILAAGGVSSASHSEVASHDTATVNALNTVQWNVSVEFRCDDGRCYFRATAGASYSHSSAQQQIDAAINAMIQQELRKGAKPTGKCDGRINGKKVR